MKLYVDDLRACPEGWVLARTITQAIRILATNEVSHISLDHDISHAVMMEGPLDGIVSRPYPCGETFEAVAWFIRELHLGMAAECFPRVTLHTANPVGAEKMRAILAEADIDATISLSQPVNKLEVDQ